MKFRSTVLCTTLALLTGAFYPATGQDNLPRIHGITPKPVLDRSAKVNRRMDPGQMIRLTLTLQPVQQADLEEFIRNAQDPRSPHFHQFMTFNEWKKKYAPSNADVAAVRGWSERNGLKVVHEFRNNLAIKVEGNVGTIEKAFDVQMNHYTTATRSFYSNDRDPALPVELTRILKNVHGLSSYHHAYSMSHGFDAAAADAEPIYVPGELFGSTLRKDMAKEHRTPFASSKTRRRIQAPLRRASIPHLEVDIGMKQLICSALKLMT